MLFVYTRRHSGERECIIYIWFLFGWRWTPIGCSTPHTEGDQSQNQEKNDIRTLCTTVRFGDNTEVTARPYIVCNFLLCLLRDPTPYLRSLANLCKSIWMLYCLCDPCQSINRLWSASQLVGHHILFTAVPMVHWGKWTFCLVCHLCPKSEM